MKKEKSCGAVVYKKEHDNLYYLIIKQSKGHIAFPKGHVEGNETNEETAIREIKEETNIDVLIDNNFKRISTYSPLKGVIKDVYYYVGTAISDNIKEDHKEVEKVKWCTYEEALQELTYDVDKKILEKANIYVKNKLLNKSM